MRIKIRNIDLDQVGDINYNRFRNIENIELEIQKDITIKDLNE